MKFRKKPVEIEAVQWTGNTAEIAQFLGGYNYMIPFDGDGVSIEITTLEGTMKAPMGWWIIKGVRGEFYPCRADIFAETYEVVV